MHLNCKTVAFTMTRLQPTANIVANIFTTRQ